MAQRSLTCFFDDVTGPSHSHLLWPCFMSINLKHIKPSKILQKSITSKMFSEIRSSSLSNQDGTFFSVSSDRTIQAVLNWAI